MCLLDLFRGMGRGWWAVEMACICLGGFSLGGSNAEGDHQKKNFFINNSVGLSMFDGPIETIKYILVNMWCMLDWIYTKLQKYTSFAYSRSTSEEWKNLVAVVPDQLLASNADLSDDLLIRWKNIKIQVWLWFCIVWMVFNTTTSWHFHYYMYCLGKTTR